MKIGDKIIIQYDTIQTTGEITNIDDNYIYVSSLWNSIWPNTYLFDINTLVDINDKNRRLCL